MTTEHSTPLRRTWQARPLSIIVGLVFIGCGLTFAALQYALPLWLQAGLLTAIGLLAIFPIRAESGKGGDGK